MTTSPVEMPATPPVPDERPWSIALSGGGHRAALFAAGVLLYLADAEELSKVGSIASVSGGSITNGVLAHSKDDMSGLDGETLRELFAKLIKRCALKGTVQYALRAKAVLAGMAISLVGVGLGIASLAGAWGHRWCGAVLIIGSAVLLVVLYESFSLVADWVFDRMFFQGARLNQVKSSVTHVFCTSELQSKLHLYLSQHFTYNGKFVDAPVPTGRIRLSTAVQASACFPPVFPTRKFRATTAGLPSTFAGHVWLSDGGVYDNMGDEWARGYWDHTHGDASDFDMGPVPKKLLVVNASAAGAGKRAWLLNRIPLIGDLYAIKAESDVMYKETTAVRRADMWTQFDVQRQLAAEDNPVANKLLAGSMIHIATPATWPSSPGQAPPAGVRPEDWSTAVAPLNGLGDTCRAAVEAACSSAASVRTTLRRVKKDRAADLLWHGYLLAMVNFVVFEGHDWQWKSRDEFVRLIKK